MDDLVLEVKHLNSWYREEDEHGRRTYDDAFWDLLNESEKEFTYAKDNTVLPDAPQLEELRDFVADCHKHVVCS